MKKRSTFTFLAITLLFTGCHSSVKQAADLIEVNLSQTCPEHEYVLQEIAEVDYLPLETKDDFLIDGSVGFMDSERIIVGSSRKDQLFFFDRKTGAPTGVLNQKGNSGKEYVNIDAFVFDGSAGEVYILDSSRKKIMVYDINQYFIRSFETKGYGKMADYDKKSLLFYREQQDSTSNPFFLISKENGEVMQTLDIVAGPRLDKFPVTVRDGNVAMASLAGVSGYMVTAQNGVLISEWNCDTMYRFDYRGALAPVAVRKPSADKMEPRWLLHVSGDNARFTAFTATMVGGFVQGALKIEERHFVYDKQAQKLVTPHFVNKDYPEEPFLYGITQYGADTVSVLSADRLFAAYGKGKLHGRLKEIASTLKEDDNPVLMIVRFK